MINNFLFILLLASPLIADLSSTSNQINFDTNSDGIKEMVLTGGSLGIGTETPSSNLHVIGNVIVTNHVYIGSNSGNSDLNINGSIGFLGEKISSHSNLSSNSLVFVDTSNSNILIELPYAANVNGRKYLIKKTSHLNALFITGGGNYIDNNQSLAFNSDSHLAYAEVVSDGSQWYLIGSHPNLTIAEVASDNLVGWYRFDETGSGSSASDSSSGGNTATITNAGSFGSGRLNNAYHFGTSTYIDVGAGTDYAYFTGLTLAAWVYHNGNASDKSIIDKFWDGVDRQFTLGLNAVSGNLAIDFRISTDTVSNAEISNGGLIPSSIWTHLAGTWNREDQLIRTYINGIETATYSVGGNHIRQNTTNLRIGSALLGGSTQFRFGIGGGPSYLDDVRIYNRALAADEILTLAQ